ncbi:hypothetical protein COY62_01980, partial [bacterium (Candidatus Howlettbacteria) CG_4_10_14_0_8_um_filter_40_9]
MGEIVRGKTLNGITPIYKIVNGRLVRGVLETDGKESFPYFDFLGFFHNDLAQSEIAGRCGFVDRDLRWVISPKYDICDDFSEGLAFVQKGTTTILIDTVGHEIAKWDEAFVTGKFSNGLANVSKMTGDGERRLVAYVNTIGEFVIPFGKELIVEHPYDLLDENDEYSEGLIRRKFKGNFGFIDKELNVVIPMTYEWTSRFSSGVAAGRKKGKYGFIDAKSQIAIPFIYDNAIHFVGNYAAVEKNACWFFIDLHGKVVNEKTYERIYQIAPTHYAVDSNGETEIVDPKLCTITRGNFAKVKAYNEGIIHFENLLEEGVADCFG